MILSLQAIGRFRDVWQLDPNSVAHRSIQAMLSKLGEHVRREDSLAQPSLIPPDTYAFGVVRHVAPEQVARLSVYP